MFLSGWLILSGLITALGTNVQNPVVIGNARFTFITPGLVRMEYALDGKFVDEPTLFAACRNTDFRDYQVESTAPKHYRLTTSQMRIEFLDNGFPFGQTNLSVHFKNDGKDKTWKIYMTTESGNLGGAVETLDNVDGPIELQEGLLSQNGWYTIFDTNKEILKDGWVQPRSPQHVQDIYLFVYGRDFKSALKSLRAVSGPVPMTRKYVHGSWYCRWWNYTADDYRQLVREYRDHDFPLDIMVFDMGWHTQRQATTGTGHAGMYGWTGYSWNRELIPDPAVLIGELNKDGIQVVLNEHPHDGIRDHEDCYPAFMHDMGMDTTGRKNLVFDAGNRKYMDRFMHHAHHESDSIGVAFWWLDWQQDYVYPIVRGTNMKHLPWLNHLYFNYSRRDGLRGAGFSRWAGWGDHRHPIQFSGDAVGNWEMLRFEIELTATSGNAGCFFWAHDIGGFYGGKDPELYTRWTQFGLLNSSLRIHSVLDKDLDRRPWLWGEKHEQAMRTVYHLRSRLMPYIYSSVRQCHTDMLPLNRCMYIDYSHEQQAYRNPQQFMFGDLLLGAPITTPANPQGEASQKIWLPGGELWYDLFTGQQYQGDTLLSATYPLERFPLFVKGGYPLPMQSYTPRMASTPLTQLIVRCYPGQEGCHNRYTLYEDDGISTEYEQGKYAETLLEYQKQNGQTHITIHPAQGTYKGQPLRRAYRIELPHTPKRLTVRVNGKKTKTTYDADCQGQVLLIKPQDIRKKIVITIQRDGAFVSSSENTETGNLYHF